MFTIRKLHGHLLIELIIVMVIFGIVVGVGALILKTHLDASLTSKNLIEVHAKTNVALERMAREIREVRAANSQNIINAETNRLTFINVRGATISYYLSNHNLMRNNQIITNGIDNLQFIYLDKNGNPTTNISNINCIKFTLTVNQNQVYSEFTSEVCPRNFVLQ